MRAKVLVVDDEPAILQGVVRSLFEHFDLTTATSGAEALQILRSEGSFAAIVSDLRMPGMNGGALLDTARRVQPDAVRLLLTGETDVQGAAAAVNAGQIFKYLCKPCPEHELRLALTQAVQLHTSLRTERQLLERTLNGAVGALTRTLSLASPTAFKRAGLIQRIVRHLLFETGETHPWQFDTAAMLAPIGCVALPADVVERSYRGAALDEQERAMFAEHPRIGRQLIEGIPRLEGVAAMVGLQNGPIPRDGSDVARGANMLRLANAAESALRRGISLRNLTNELQGDYPAQLLEALSRFSPEQTGTERLVSVADLRPGMVPVDDIIHRSGAVVIAGGHELDALSIARARNMHRTGGVREPFRVRVP